MIWINNENTDFIGVDGISNNDSLNSSTKLNVKYASQPLIEILEIWKFGVEWEIPLKRWGKLWIKFFQVNIPNAIIVALRSNFVSILRRNDPMQIPNMYGDNLDHGWSWKLLKNARFSLKLTLHRWWWNRKKNGIQLKCIALMGAAFFIIVKIYLAFIPASGFKAWNCRVVVAMSVLMKNDENMMIPKRGWFFKINRIILETT